MGLAASIIVATYCPNKTRYGFCEQSFSEIHRTGIKREDYELIVVSNGGIHLDLIKQLDTDIVLTVGHNIGQAAALNAGVAIAKGENLAVMDDDMSFAEGWLGEGLKMLRRFPEHVTSLRPLNKRYETGDAGKGYTYARNVGGNWIMRRGLMMKVGRFGQEYYDWGGLWTRNLLRGGSRFVVSKKPYLEHIGRRKSIIGNKKGLVREYRNPRTP